MSVAEALALVLGNWWVVGAALVGGIGFCLAWGVDEGMRRAAEVEELEPGTFGAKSDTPA